MRGKSSVDSLFLTRTGFVEFFVVFVKLLHGLTAISPAIILLFYPDPVAEPPGVRVVVVSPAF